jgi:CBF1 interacting corepressor
MSLAFLGKKSWHTTNPDNVKKVWIAEQKVKQKVIDEKEMALQVARETDNLAYKQKLAAKSGDRSKIQDAAQAAMNFMYSAPPGYDAKQGEKDSGGGEDEAVKDFERRMKKHNENFSSSAMQNKLEKDVGRKRSTALTLEEQVERFPMLKNAPVEGAYTADVKINFNPLGVQINNTRCLRCGEWGHRSGDRECKLRDFNPHDAARQKREDPMTYMSNHLAAEKQSIVLKKASLPLEMRGAGHGHDPAEENQQLVMGSSDEEDPEERFLKTLSYKEKKLLMKKLQSGGDMFDDGAGGAGAGAGGGGREKKSKKEKKEKKRKKKEKKEKKKKEKKKGKGRKRRRDGSDSDSSSGDDDSDGSSADDSDADARKLEAAKRFLAQHEAADKAAMDADPSNTKRARVVPGGYLPTKDKWEGHAVKMVGGAEKAAEREAAARGQREQLIENATALAAAAAEGGGSLLVDLQFSKSGVIDKSKQAKQAR